MEVFLKIVGAVAILFGIALFLAVPTMLLWDWLMPTLFGLKEITLLQAWGINFLSGILFKNNTSSK